MSSDKLTLAERKRILEAAGKIHTYKIMQVKGYRALIRKAENEEIRQLLIRTGDNEEKNAQFWAEIIQELGGTLQHRFKTYFRDRKVGLLMSILGTKGFFEWAVIGEEEAIQDLVLIAENIIERSSSETWSRYASDERIHLERIKNEILGMETWEIRGGGGVKDMIFGANDGLVSTLAFVAGVFGAITDPYIVLLSGIAELFAGTISMAAGAYQSSKSELEVLERESNRRRMTKGRTPEQEREELMRFYEAEGFKRTEAEAIVNRIVQKEEQPIPVGTLKDLGLAPEEIGNPVRAGILCGVSFGIAAIVPILPFVMATNSWQALLASIVATMSALFGVGAMKTIFSRRNWVRSGLEMMIIGTFAAAVTYTIGKIFSWIV